MSQDASVSAAYAKLWKDTLAALPQADHAYE